MEILVAMVISAVLVVLVGKTVGQIIRNSTALHERLKTSRSSAAFRKMLHRDFQNMPDPESISFTSSGFSFETSHNLLLDGPMDVSVNWNFSQETIERKESAQAVGYEKTIELYSDVSEWTLEMYSEKEERWIDLDTWILTGDEEKEKRTSDITAVKLTVRRGGESQFVPEEEQKPQSYFEIIERFPQVRYDK